MASKCRQLAEALRSMATQMCYEDVRQASNHLSQCASNVITVSDLRFEYEMILSDEIDVFKAINGPLQGRGSVLDLDYNRANMFPSDYDTDLESEWTNESQSIDVLIQFSIKMNVFI